MMFHLRSLALRRSGFSPALCLALGVGGCALAGCSASDPQQPAAQAAIGVGEGAKVSASGAASASAQGATPVRFVDVAREAGIRFKHHNGAFGLVWTPEVMGSGVAFIDGDGDGWQDIFFINNRDWTPEEIEQYKKGSGAKHRETYNFVPPMPPKRGRTPVAFYRNKGDGTFEDATKSAGLDIEMFGMGAAVGDYDNDGRADLYVTAVGRNYLFRNESRGKQVRFREVSRELGVRDGGWSIAPAWLDYDRDGKLDLFVSHYLDWSPAKDAYLDYKGTKKHASPKHYKPVLSTLYRNEGGRFRDVSERAGLTRARRGGKSEPVLGKAMGVAVGDINNDLWPDIVVTNDLMANQLFRNTGKGGFVEEAHQAGVVFGDAARARSGMGADMGDFDRSNRESVAIANFETEKLALYQNQGNGLFLDVAAPAGVAEPTARYVGFGVLFSDYDNDGWLDLAVTNGHVYETISEVDPVTTYAQIPLLLRNRGGESPALGVPVRKASGRTTRVVFEDVGARGGEVWTKPIVGRGLAQADFDLDGDPDLLVVVNNGRPLLLRNDGGNKNNSLRVVLRGTKSNRAAIGAGVWAVVDKEMLRRRVKSGSSYLSESELAATFGLGRKQKVDTLAVRWPSGKLSQFKDVAANQIVTIDEQKGIVRKVRFPGRKVLARP